MLARYNNVHLGDRGRRELGKIGAVQLITIVGGQLFCHTIHRTTPGKGGRIGMCGTVNSHNIGPGWEAFHRSNKVLYHGIFAVGILLIGVTLQIETPFLNDTGIGALIFLAGQLSRGPQVCLVACAGRLVLMPDIGADKNRLRTVRFDAAVEIQNQLIVGESLPSL